MKRFASKPARKQRIRVLLSHPNSRPTALARIFSTTFLAAALLANFGCSKKQSPPTTPPSQNTNSATSETNALQTEIDKRLNKIRQDGHPASADELDQSRPPASPEYQTLLSAWTNATLAISPIPHDVLVLTVGKDPIPGNTLAHLRQYVAANHKPLEQLHRLAPSVASLRNIPRNQAGDFNLINAEVDSGQLLQLAAVLQAQDGKLDEAIGHLETLIALQEAFFDQPGLGWLLNTGCSSTAVCEAIEFLLNHSSRPNQVQLARLQTFLQKGRNSNNLSSALVGDRAVVISEFQNWREQILPGLLLLEETSGDSRGPLPAAQVRLLTDRFERQKDADLLFYLEVMDDLIAASGLPYPESLTSIDRLAEIIRKQESLPKSERHPYSTRHLPVDVLVEFASDETAQRSAEIALAVEQYRLAHNQRLPADLSELTPTYLPTVPTNPFSGHPFSLKVLSLGYEIGDAAPLETYLSNFKNLRLYQKSIARRVTFTVGR